jgi:photosystem II stability/assembly factor-like uncharacterized protein
MNDIQFRTRMAQAAITASLVLLLSACGGGNSASTSNGEKETTVVPASSPAAPYEGDSAALQAHGAALNTEELGDALAQAKALPADSALLAGQVAPLAAYKSGAVAQKAAAVQLPVYRFYNTQTGTHFYTSSVTERDSVRSNLPFMTYEGMAFYAASQPSAGLKPVYRLFNARFGTHFYTISESERDTLQDQLPDSRLEGIAYYASPVAGMGFKPLYRFFWSRAGSFSGNHFYTASEVERQNLQDNQSATYTYEGVGYYVLTGDCTLVNSTSQQATANACYLANNAAAPVNITLPASADLAVGDTLKVAGIGAGGWRISQSAGQYVQTTVAGAEPFLWTARESSRDWYSIASSADGKKLVAVNFGTSVGNGGRIYTSTDSGVTWTPRENARNWYSVASSADGSKLVAAVYQGNIYTSTDSGVTWTPRENVRNWYSVASSADGNKLVAAALHSTNPVYTSTDGGVNWTARSPYRHPTKSGRWAIASSADGDKLVGVEYNVALQTSADSGSSWTTRTPERYWYSVASSADGNRLIATVDGGYLYSSANAGVDWTARDSSRPWQTVASSADGNKLVAVEKNGHIYTSDDAGLTWKQRANTGPWRSVAVSADGNKLVAGQDGGQLYTSQTSTLPGTAGYLEGASGSSIELKYLGNDVFEMIDSSGTVTAKVEPI